MDFPRVKPQGPNESERSLALLDAISGDSVKNLPANLIDSSF